MLVAAALAASLAASCDGTRGTLVSTRADAGSDAGDAGAEDAGLPSEWLPPAHASFQLQLTGDLDTSVAADVYFLDLDYAQNDLSMLESAGAHVVCHFSAGSAENFRADIGDISDDALGNVLDDYPDERWLDVRDGSVREVMRARLDRAAAEGCAGVLPTNLAGHLDDTGFDLEEADALDYAEWLAREAGTRGLSVALSTDEMIGSLGQSYDMGLAFECLADDACERWSSMRDRGKTVMVVEVGDQDPADELCPTARAQGLVAIVKHRNYDAFRIACPE